MLDFRKSGMSNDLGWTIRATTDRIEKIVKEMPDRWEKRVS